MNSSQQKYDVTLQNKIIDLAIEKGWGFLPDPIEIYLELKGVACILNQAPSTLQNYKCMKGIEHKFGGMYRITEVANSVGEEREEKRKDKGD